MKEITAFKRVLNRRGKIKDTDITYEIRNGDHKLQVTVIYDYEPKKDGYLAILDVYRSAVKAAENVGKEE